MQTELLDRYLAGSPTFQLIVESRIRMGLPKRKDIGKASAPTQSNHRTTAATKNNPTRLREPGSNRRTPMPGPPASKGLLLQTTMMVATLSPIHRPETGPSATTTLAVSGSCNAHQIAANASIVNANPQLIRNFINITPRR